MKKIAYFCLASLVTVSMKADFIEDMAGDMLSMTMKMAKGNFVKKYIVILGDVQELSKAAGTGDVLDDKYSSSHLKELIKSWKDQDVPTVIKGFRRVKKAGKKLFGIIRPQVQTDTVVDPVEYKTVQDESVQHGRAAANHILKNFEEDFKEDDVISVIRTLTSHGEKGTLKVSFIGKVVPIKDKKESLKRKQEGNSGKYKFKRLYTKWYQSKSA